MVKTAYSSFLRHSKIILRKKTCSKLIRRGLFDRNESSVKCNVNKGFVYLFSVLMFDIFISQSYGSVHSVTSPICYHCLSLFESINVPEPLSGQAYFVTKMPENYIILFTF